MAAGAVQARRDVVPALLAAATAALIGTSSAPHRFVIDAPAGAGRTWTLDAVSSAFPLDVHRATAFEASMASPYGVLCELIGLPRPNPVPPDLANAAIARVENLAHGSAIALVVDNLHWVDAQSLDALRQLCTPGAGSGTVLIAGVRSGSERAAVRQLLTDPETAVWPLPAFDRVDLDVLVHDRTGCWPGERLRDLLAQIAGNALHLMTVLDGLLVSQGAVASKGLLELVGRPDDAGMPSLATMTDDLVATIGGAELDLARALAVVGAPASPEYLAGLLSVAPTSLVPSMRRLLDAGVVISDEESIAFGRDSWRQAIYDATPGPIRNVLHRAAAERLSGAERARHVVASGSGSNAVLDAISEAQSDLGNSPAVTAELLGQAADNSPGGTPGAARLAVTRARALARSGQVDRAASVARAALTWTNEPDVVGQLRRITIFTLSTRAQVAEAVALIDETLGWPLPDRTRRLLGDHRKFLQLMGHSAPVPTEPFVEDTSTLTLNGLVAEGMRRALLGNTAVGLELVWTASRLAMSEGVDPNEGSSADIWPPFVELVHNGPRSAEAALIEVINLREKRGAAWQTAGHQAIGAAIAFYAGRLDDAAAEFDSALDAAEQTGMGWISSTVGERIRLDIFRGRLPEARTRVAAWDRSPQPDQFGIPAIDRSRIAILEAERRYAEAAALAAQVWSRAGKSRLFGWRASVAPDFARVALRAADGELRQAIYEGLSASPPLDGATTSAARQLASAMTGPDYGEVVAVAAQLTAGAIEWGDGLLRLSAVEEAAVALAVGGERDSARLRAREAMTLADEFGAPGISARISGRMRAAGVRLGSVTSRGRGASGWRSLTPTEARVVALVVDGTSGPDIARQLFVSPRTVQTHVSHALAKLGFSNRMELAAAARMR